jgi:hypothetical protein
MNQLVSSRVRLTLLRAAAYMKDGYWHKEVTTTGDSEAQQLANVRQAVVVTLSAAPRKRC